MRSLPMLALFGLLAGALFARAADKPAPTGFLDRTYDSFKYVVFIPKDYNADKAYPLILFLHGAGERGTDGKRQSEVGLGKAVKKHADTFPFIVVFPQAQKTWKVGSDDSKRALAILDQVEKDYKVDKKRVYLTGLSMGGYGTWDLAAADPKRWAAIVPICGGGDPKAANRFKDLPCWAFHGDADPAVPVARSREMIAALKAAGGEPKYSEFPGVGHLSWDQAYATEGLFDWMLKQESK